MHGSWDSTFEYNNIGFYQQVSDDLGAFYSDDLISRHGNQTFRYNFLHDTPLGNGIDFDGDYLDMNIYGNVMNLNTIPSESQGIGIRYQNADQATSGDQQSVNCYNNLVANGHYGITFVALLPSVISANAAIACNNPFTWSQVIVGSGSNSILGSSQAAMQSGTNLSYASDPGFLSLTNDDLRLNPFSRVYSDMTNFAQIPVEMIGNYNDEFRTNAGGYSPYVATASAAYVTSSNAVCNGQLYFPQFASNTTITIYYGLTDGGSNAGAWQFSTNLGVFPAGPLSGLVGGLQGGTNYYFRCFAANAYGSAWSPASSSLVTPPPPPVSVITNVSSQVVLTGSVATLTGRVAATGPLYPAAGEMVGVTINGSTQTGLVSDSTGDFSVSYSATNLMPTPTPYPVIYAYGGDTNLSSATNGGTTLTVVPASIIWTGAAGTNFETGGLSGNWSGYPAPLNDLVSCAAVFGNPPTVEPAVAQPQPQCQWLEFRRDHRRLDAGQRGDKQCLEPRRGRPHHRRADQREQRHQRQFATGRESNVASRHGREFAGHRLCHQLAVEHKLFTDPQCQRQSGQCDFESGGGQQPLSHRQQQHRLDFSGEVRRAAGTGG